MNASNRDTVTMALETLTGWVTRRKQVGKEITCAALRILRWNLGRQEVALEAAEAAPRGTCSVAVFFWSRGKRKTNQKKEIREP